MARKKHSPEQIVAILRQIEIEVANHKPIGQACPPNRTRTEHCSRVETYAKSQGHSPEWILC